MFLKEFTIGLLLFSIFGMHIAHADDKPLLRIETDRHWGRLTDISAAKNGSIFVTSSEDKTVRIWDASGRQLKVIRPPIGDGHIGKIYSVAISPDGSTVAYSFFTKYFWEETKQELEIFKTHINHWQTDNLIKSSLRELAPVKLAFSPDGKFLARYGADILINRTSDWSLFAMTSFFDKDVKLYGGEDKVWDSLQFFPKENRFAAIRDKKIYFFSIKTGDYSKQPNISDSIKGDIDDMFDIIKRLTLDKIEKKLSGKDPASLSISSNGTKIAISYIDSTDLTILDNKGAKLELSSPDLKSAYIASLPSMFSTWSLDGKNLFAGGFASKKFGGAIVIRKWTLLPKPSYQDIVISETRHRETRHPVFKLVPLENGLAFISDYPIGIVDQSGAQFSIRLLKPLGMHDQYIPHASTDGKKIGFSYKDSGEVIGDDYTFDIPSRSLVFEKAGFATDLFSNIDGFDEKVPGLEARGQLSDKPELNGVLLDVDSRALSYSFSAERNSLLLGTSWFLYQFNSTGKLVWRVTAPDRVTGLNVTRDGRFIVAAIGDGTIRWYRSSDGAEQLAFFPHLDRKRWVMWTPSGYYDASPGAEDLIGWHVNNGENQVADFFPASRFRDHFYRPDVLTKILETRDETEALRLANQESGRRTQIVAVQQVLPPIVEILSPTSDSVVKSATVKVRYRVRTLADAPVTGIRVRVNGQAVSVERALMLKTGEGDAHELEIVIPEQDSEIALFAENKNGVSVAAILRMTWAGKKAAAFAEDNLFKPNLYVLAVGVSKYKNSVYNLELAAKDAADFVAVFQKQKGKLYGDVVVKLLTDGTASKDDVLDGLEWLKQQVTARDVGVIFLAGHGMNDNIGNYYFLPHNAEPDKLLRTGVAQNDIKLTLNSLAGKVMFFVDSCHSGNALGTSKTRALSGTTDAFVNELASAENGVIVFSSSTGKQLSQENAAWGNGAFTKAVVEGLSGKADFAKNGKITHKGLDYYVTERVKELTKGQQSPVSISPSGVTDFPIAVVGW